MLTITDEERMQDIIAQTAEFRFRICWQGAHALLRGRGIDPLRVLRLSCDQGDDVNTDLVLPDGVLVNVDFKENPKTREFVSISEWRMANWSDRDVELARQIVGSGDTTEFDQKVQRYFDQNWRDQDAPLTCIGLRIARGPLLDLHRRSSATIGMKDGWEVAVRYPHQPDRTGNVLVDLSHVPTFEINGPNTGSALTSICGVDVPLRKIHSGDGRHVYRLTPGRAIVFGNSPSNVGAIDVTGGWTSLALIGPDAERILNKVTAVDLRERTWPVQACCQGPIFGVNTLFGRFTDRFELHVCSDSAEFFWDVLMDAGAEFGLRPAGIEWMSEASSQK